MHFNKKGDGCWGQQVVNKVAKLPANDGKNLQSNNWTKCIIMSSYVFHHLFQSDPHTDLKHIDQTRNSENHEAVGY